MNCCEEVNVKLFHLCTQMRKKDIRGDGGSLTMTGCTIATSLREGAGWYCVEGVPGEFTEGRYCNERSRRNASDKDDDIDVRWW